MTNKEKIAAYINKIRGMEFNVDSDAIEMVNYQNLLKSLEKDTITYNDYAFMNMCPIEGLCGFACDGRCLHGLPTDNIDKRKMSCWEKALATDPESENETTFEFELLRKVIAEYKSLSKTSPDYILVNKDLYKKMMIDNKMPISFIEEVPVVMTNLEFQYGYKMVKAIDDFVF